MNPFTGNKESLEMKSEPLVLKLGMMWSLGLDARGLLPEMSLAPVYLVFT